MVVKLQASIAGQSGHSTGQCSGQSTTNVHQIGSVLTQTERCELGSKLFSECT